MNRVLKCGFYYKFELDPETAKLFIEKYPLNEQQRCICDRLRVPYLLWSFYIFKKKSIRYIWQRVKYTNRYGYFYIKDCNLVQKTTFYDDMKLTYDEKFFIFHHLDIDEYRRNSFCFYHPITTLQNLCFRRISTEWSRWYINSLSMYLPKKIFQKLQAVRIPMPEHDREGMRALFYEACFPLKDLFSEIDTWIYSKEFVVWFQNDALIHERFRDEFPIKIIHFHFYKSRKRYFVCMEWMKKFLENTKKITAFQRCYYDLDCVTPFVKKNIQSRSNWCGRCKQVPLFHVVSLEDFEKQYPNHRSRRRIKVVHFL